LKAPLFALLSAECIRPRAGHELIQKSVTRAMARSDAIFCGCSLPAGSLLVDRHRDLSLCPAYASAGALNRARWTHNQAGK
jgi:hypothetical protein